MIEIGPNLTTVAISMIGLVGALIAAIRSERALAEVQHSRLHIERNTRSIERLQNGEKASAQQTKDT